MPASTSRGKKLNRLRKSLQRFGARWRKPKIEASTRISDRKRYKDRVGWRNVTDSRRHLHHRTKEIVAFLDRFAGMYADPYMNGDLAGFVV